MEQKDIFESIRDVKKALQKADKYIPKVEERSIDRAEIKEAVKLFRHVVFGNYFGALDLSTSLSRLYSILSHQIDYIGRIFHEPLPCSAEEIAQQFIESIPELRRLLGTDVKAIFDGDPAAVSHEEVILCTMSPRCRFSVSPPASRRRKSSSALTSCNSSFAFLRTFLS